MKLFNKMKVLIIILLGVTILAAILGSFRKEGFKDDVVGCSGETVPECYDTVLKYSDYDNSNYMLKTKMVVPSCPVCPTKLSDENEDEDDDEHWHPDINRSHGHRDHSRWDDEPDPELTDDKSKSQPAEVDGLDGNDGLDGLDGNDGVDGVDGNKGDKGNKGNKGNKGESGKDGKDGQIVKIAGQTIQTAPNVGLAGSGDSTNVIAGPSKVDQSLIDSINDIKHQLAFIKNKEPEPAFECKKVPNYRSPYTQNYMPLPVLNDFSKF
jgi:hypothetical protein